MTLARGEAIRQAKTQAEKHHTTKRTLAELQRMAEDGTPAEHLARQRMLKAQAMEREAVRRALARYEKETR